MTRCHTSDDRGNLPVAFISLYSRMAVRAETLGYALCIHGRRTWEVVLDYDAVLKFDVFPPRKRKPKKTALKSATTNFLVSNTTIHL